MVGMLTSLTKTWVVSVWLVPLAALPFAACTGFRDTPEAVQHIHLASVPPAGPIRPTFPIGLYHALSGEHFGRRYSLEPLAAAGFDTVHLWRGQALEPALAEAHRLGLRVLWEYPTDAEVEAHAGDPTILGWILDEEPSTRAEPEDIAARLADFRRRQSQLHESDPAHPVFIIDSSPPKRPSRATAWRQWLREGDVSCHFNYPIASSWFGLDSLDTPRGIPNSVAEAVEATGGTRPFWLLVQAFSSPSHGWAWPSPAQLDAMTWAGVIHGATGIVFFAYDSFVTRDGDVVGIGPDPVADYGDIPDFDHSGTPAMVAGSEDLATGYRLWDETLRLVTALRRLSPALIASTADFPYRIAVKGVSNSATPVRTLLKSGPDGLVLLAVNLDDTKLTVRLEPGRRLESVEAIVGPPPRPSADAPGSWEAELEPFAIRAWRLATP